MVFCVHDLAVFAFQMYVAFRIYKAVRTSMYFFFALTTHKLGRVLFTAELIGQQAGESCCIIVIVNRGPGMEV